MSAALLAATASVDEWEIIARLGAAAGLAGAMGLQRELAGHDAGVRTHALLALGAALFGIVSVNAWAPYVDVRADTNIQVDVTRIASYVAAGVGFLAGGVIVKQADRVKGLTTASSLWVAAAVGLSAGLGALLGAATATAITLVALVLAGPIERLTQRHRSNATIRVVVNGPPDALLALLRERTTPSKGLPPSMTVSKHIPRTTVVLAGISATTGRALVEELATWRDVEECELGTG